MKAWLKRGIIILILAVMFILPTAIYAAFAAANLIEEGMPDGLTPLGSESGVGNQCLHQSFYAAGRNWLFYMDYDAVNLTNDLVYTSAIPGQAWSTPTIVADNTGLYAIEFAVFYDNQYGKIHYARHNMTPNPDEVAYRMGTPASTGVITWAAAEQTVATTPAVLATWRTTIAVDEDGYPWVAWIDTNGVDAYGIVYVEASSTRDGTWTQDASVTEEFDTADYHAWFVSLTPVANGAGANYMEVGYSYQDNTGGAHDGEVSLQVNRYNATTGWGAAEAAVAYGGMNSSRPDAFSFYDLGSAVHLVYTDELGSVLYRVHSSIQTWDTCAAATAIKEDPGDTSIPTLSGYENIGAGEDLICIIHQDTNVQYSIKPYSDSWNTWATIWQTDDPSDFISRHIANYNYNPTTGEIVGFAWQVTDDSDTPDTDNLYFWWFDNNDGLGYYPGGIYDYAGAAELVNLIPMLVVVGLFITGGFFIYLGTKGGKGNIKSVLAGIIMIVVSLLLIPVVIQMVQYVA